ncbi:MAG: hypothetical protein ACYTGC_19465, partial [Planctomycetota bacterium]
MTLRTKTLLIIGLTLVGLVTIVYALTRWVFLGSFAELERQAVASHASQARRLVRRELEALDLLTNEYSGDATCDYLAALAAGDAESADLYAQVHLDADLFEHSTGRRPMRSADWSSPRTAAAGSSSRARSSAAIDAIRSAGRSRSRASCEPIGSRRR